MKTFGAQPLVQGVGIVKCKDCLKPILRSAILEHAGMHSVRLSYEQKLY